LNFWKLDISTSIFVFIKHNQKKFKTLDSANKFIREVSGIVNFFETKKQLNELKSLISETENTVQESNRREYGDFQTNEILAYKTIQYVLSRHPNTNFEFLIEPTCGKGNFILAALKQINTLKKIVGIEIYQPYVWETKFKILDFYIRTPILKAIIFPDSKRSITKDILMRIDFNKLYNLFDFNLVQKDLDTIKIKDWEEFEILIQQKQENKQIN
jgi:hypothetical protein